MSTTRLRLVTQLSVAALVGTTLSLVVLTALTRAMVGERFQRIEEAEAAANLDRAAVSLQVDLEQLDGITFEWSIWDDPYELAAGVENDFVDDNMHADSLSRLRVSEVLFIDSAGAVVCSMGQSAPGAALRPADPAWLPVAHAAGLQRSRGYLSVGGVAYAYATSPLQPSAGSGPPTGLVLMARRLDLLVVPAIDRLSAQRLSVGPPPAPGARPSVIALQTPTVLVGDRAIFNAAGEAIAALHMVDDRPVNQQAIDTERSLLIGAMVAALMGGLLGVLIIHRRVTVPTTRLAAAVRAVRGGASPAEAIPALEQSEELHDLSLGLREALTAVQAAEAVSRQRALDEQVQRARGDFFARVSHELRTPMNGVLGSMELLEQTPLRPDQRRLVGTVQSSALTLLALINDVLDLSKVDAGRLSLTVRAVPVLRLLWGVADLLRPVAEARGLYLRAELELDDERRALLDPHRLRQVLVNLVGNAIKYTVEGGVTLRATRYDGQLIVDVLDTGPGIAPALQAEVFEPFVMGQGAGAEVVGHSTGLGLSICRELVRLMDGELRLQSTLGEGSCFTLKVPWVPTELPADADLGLLLGAPPAPPRPDAPAADAPPAAGAPLALDSLKITPVKPSSSSAPASPADGLRGLEVLLVEDNPVNQMVAEGMLELLGCVVTVAEHGGHALRALEAKAFAIVLMDCQMPVMDGFEATRQLRAREVGRRTPVLAVTANAMAGDAERCLAAGMDGFLAKPLGLAALRASMLAVLRPGAEATG